MLNLKKYYAVLFALFFLALQATSFAHSTEFGFGRHSHDGIACSVLHTHENEDDEEHSLGEDDNPVPPHTLHPIRTAVLFSVLYRSNARYQQQLADTKCKKVRAPPLA